MTTEATPDLITETPAAPVEAESLLATPPAADPAAPPAGENDWLPEKFRVNTAEGSLDEAASARKLAESYKALEAHKGPLSQAPATADDYKIEAPKDAEGKPMEVDIAAFTGDPAFKAFAAKAHELGYSNDQLQFAVDRYLTMAPELLAADQSLSLAEAKAELSKIWTNDQAMQANLASVRRAIQGFGAEAADVPGSRDRLMSKYGRDPDFIAFAASVAGEMKEDQPVIGGMAASEVDAESLMKGEAYWNPKHADHARVKSQVDTFHAKKFGTAAHR
jgi:hypothetical protein